MNKATRKFKVGLVVVGSGVMFLGLVLFILGSSLSSGFVHYSILFEESVKGMVIGSKVNFQGIPVGKVIDIRFESGKTRVEIAVKPGKAEIQEVTSARMDRLMITGQVTVELEGYRADANLLEVGGLIPPRKSAFDEFAQSLPEVVADVDDLLLSLKALADRVSDVLDDDNRRMLKHILADLARTSAVLADEMAPMIQEARTTVTAMKPALASMQKGFDKVGAIAGSEGLRGALERASAAMVRLDEIETQVLRLVQDLRGVVGGSRRGWMGTLTTARDALNEIRMLARNLRMAPSSLVFGRGEREIKVPVVPAGGRK